MEAKKFSHARMSLTLWYELFLVCIVIAFSLALFTTETGNFARVVIARNFGPHVPRLLSPEEVEEIQSQVEELRRSFIIDLGVIDTAILLIGGGLGYLLAGKTLDPIRKTYEHQKEFLANASHEFRTPLAAIQTASEVVLRSPTKTKEDYKKVITQTLQESKRLGVMAEELLMLSRIDAGIAVLHFAQLDLSKIVEEGIREIEPMLDKKEIHIKKQIGKHMYIFGDKDRLKQLVLILLDNATKFTPKNGSITVSLTQIPKPTLSISDTGIGIDSRDMPHIFDRFYQADTVRGGNSAGLGLSIAKWIVDAHSGKITVTSGKNMGTTFSVAFDTKK